MIEVPVSGGLVALIDDEAAHLVVPYRWTSQRLGNTFYAVRHTGGRNIRMHQVIMPLPKGWEVDHRDGNGLNNTGANLRPATKRQQQQNRRPQVHSSQFKGVQLLKSHGCARWCAVIVVNGRRILRVARSEIDAAQRYNAMARLHFGDFARLNEIPGG